jgi:hypothetical protein
MQALAYKAYQNVPLYLEWAPLGTFLPTAPAAAPSRLASASGRAMVQDRFGSGGDEDDDADGAGRGDDAVKESSTAARAPTPPSADATKLSVRNVSFQASAKVSPLHFEP